MFFEGTWEHGSRFRSQLIICWIPRQLLSSSTLSKPPTFYYTNLLGRSVHPPIARGLAMTKKALEAAGHEVFEWAPTDHPEIAHEMNSSFHNLGGAAILNLTERHEEPVFGSMKAYEVTHKKGESTMGPTKLREMITRRNAFQKAYMDRWNATTKDGQVMDGIIMPASPWTAPRLGFTQKVFSVNFTGVWNLLGRCLSAFHFWDLLT